MKTLAIALLLSLSFALLPTAAASAAEGKTPCQPGQPLVDCLVEEYGLPVVCLVVETVYEQPCHEVICYPCEATGRP